MGTWCKTVCAMDSTGIQLPFYAIFSTIQHKRWPLET